MISYPILVPLSTVNDISKFYSEYTTDNIELLNEYHDRSFHFIIDLSELLIKKESVESLLFELVLISQHFKKFNCKFQLTCVLPDKQDQIAYDRYFEDNNIKFKILSYMSTIRDLIDVNITDDEGNIISTKSDEHIKRMLPIMEINSRLLGFLISPVHSRVVEKWVDGNLKLPLVNAKNKQVRFLYNQCARLLYGDMDEGKALTELRKRAFSSEHFKGFINNIPFIALLIFAMFDYAYREDAAEKLKNEIKSEQGSLKVTLTEEDILEQYQYKQKYERYQKHEILKHEGYDNKTIFEYMDITNSEKPRNDKLHPFVIKEIYEAVTISEGLYQLIENIVQHAGKEKGTGEGILSLYIHNLNKDKEVLQNKYPAYFQNQNLVAKFILEVNIADLSNTDIPTEFRKNNKNFRHENHLNYPKGIGSPVSVFENIMLKDFFKPDKTKLNWWRYFFSTPDRAINHYGLQIFNSIIEAKGGYFFVQSGSETYSSVPDEKRETIKKKGTSYTVLLPLDGCVHYDNNIYDSMFKYSLSSYLGKKMKISNITNIPESPQLPFNKVEHINKILSCLPRKINADEILLFDLAVLNKVHLECLVKAILKLIFGLTRTKNKLRSKLYISFINCKNYQLLDILRILALYYDKQGVNRNMNFVEVYIRGLNIGEEILVYGENLETVRNNICQSACMRGLSYKYVDTLDKILSDREVR